MAEESRNSGAASGIINTEASQQTFAEDSFLQLGEIRAATDDDFDYFVHLAERHENWIKKLDKNGLVVWQKETGHSTIKMAKVCSEFQNVSASIAFDTLMDGEYRKIWDDNVIEDFEVCRLNDFNDIGYYSICCSFGCEYDGNKVDVPVVSHLASDKFQSILVKCPIPLKNRDFVNQRSWKIFSEDQFVLFNHSVQHHELPPKKNFIRGLSYVTGFLIRSSSKGCELIYVTQSDPRGKLPKWIINLAVNKIAPAIFKQLYVAAIKYVDWKTKNKPDYKPWRKPEQSSIPLVDAAVLKQKLVDTPQNGLSVLSGDQDEEVPTEEGMEEFVDHLVESLESEHRQ